MRRPALVQPRGDVVDTGAGLQIFRLDGIRQPASLDLEAVRAEVRKGQDAEAGRAAIEAERQRVWDDAALTLDTRALARPGQPGDLVVSPKGTAHGGTKPDGRTIKAIAIKTPPQAPDDTKMLN